MFDGGLREAFEGLSGVAGGSEVGVRLLLTLLVVVGALVLSRLVARAVRRRFGTAGQGGGGGPSEAGRRRRAATTATAPTGSGRWRPTPCGGWRY